MYSVFLFFCVIVFFMKTSYFKRFSIAFNEFSKQHPDLFIFLYLLLSSIFLFVAGNLLDPLDDEGVEGFLIDSLFSSFKANGGEGSLGNIEVKDEVASKVTSKIGADEGSLGNIEVKNEVASKVRVDEGSLLIETATARVSGQRSDNYSSNAYLTIAVTSAAFSDVTDPYEFSDIVQPCRAPWPSYVEFAGAGESGVVPLSLRVQIDDLLEPKFSHVDNEYHLTVDDEKNLRCLFFELYSPKPYIQTTLEYKVFLRDKNIKIIQN